MSTRRPDIPDHRRRARIISDRSGLNGPTIVGELASVGKFYGPSPALATLSLQVRSGEVLAVLGPNGAGKTTFINLLLGLARPSSGAALLFGSSPGSPRNRARVEVMLQLSGAPATPSVREHLELFRSYYPAPLGLRETLETAGLLGSSTGFTASSRAGRNSGFTSRSPSAASPI